jgi:acyl-homoserine lactone acylase PvdQ
VKTEGERVGAVDIRREVIPKELSGKKSPSAVLKDVRVDSAVSQIVTMVGVASRWGGASFREIIDLADWDRSVATSTPGQSGQPGSPHYGDLLPLWAEGRYFPLVFSREAVEANTVNRLVLQPPPP